MQRERGVGGEKETAKKKLSKLLSDNNLTEDDLNEELISYYLFSYQGAHKRHLLGQIIYKVIGAVDGKPPAIYKSKGTRNKIGVYCTASQKIEIELDFEFYSRLLDEEFEVVTEAFIDAQNLFPSNAPVSTIDPNSLSQEEIERLNKLTRLSAEIDKKTRYVMIEDKGEQM